MKHGVARFSIWEVPASIRRCGTPLKEECLLSGPRPTNSAYALAKIAGLEMCRHYRAQYGVLFTRPCRPTFMVRATIITPTILCPPALIRRFHEAKEKNLAEVCIWGLEAQARIAPRRRPSRRFAAFARCGGSARLGKLVREDQTILELAKLVKEVIGYTGKITHDLSKPDGTPIKGWT